MHQAIGCWATQIQDKPFFWILGIDAGTLEGRIAAMLEEPADNCGQLFPGLMLQILHRSHDLYPHNFALILSLADGPRYETIPECSIPLGYFDSFDLYFIDKGFPSSRMLFARYGIGDLHLTHSIAEEVSPKDHHTAICEAWRRLIILAELIRGDSSDKKNSWPA